MATETVPNIVRGRVPYDDAHECSAMLFDVLSCFMPHCRCRKTAPHLLTKPD